MTKVRIISGVYEADVTIRINEFIETHKIVDIQFQTNGENQVRTVFSAMIIYEEE